MVAYALLSLVYQGYLRQFGSDVDPMSKWLGQHAAWSLRAVGYGASSENTASLAEQRVLIDTVAKVKVIEGCNGLSVMVLFVSFMLGFGRFTWDKARFMGLGLMAIHAFNVMRVAVLALLIHHTDRTYYDLQKNMFTGSIYVLVLVLWVWWTHRATLTNNPANHPKE